ncbi:MAG: solute carrier family 23 protein [Ruthenibacterium sp.]
MDSKKKSQADLFSLSGIPSFKKAIPLSLQHVLAAVVGIVTPAIMVAHVCNLSKPDEVLLVQSALLISAVCTFLQCLPIFGPIGSRLPVVFGTSFAYVPTLLALGGEFGIASIFGAQACGALVAVLFGIFIKQLHPLFPPIVAGTVVFSIGLSLYPTAVGYMAGGNGSADFGSAKNWLVALCTLAVVLGITFFTKGILKLSALLCGILAGYGLSCALGMVNFAGLSEAGFVSLPRFLPFGIRFDVTAIITMAVLVLVNSVQAVGDFTATTTGGLDREPTDKELSGGNIASGLGNFIGAFFGGLPTASYSQNVGLVVTTRVVNRAVIAIAAGIIALAGLFPKIGFILTTVPPAVLGGATISVFSSIAMTGIKVLTSEHLTARNVAVAGISVALGSGLVQVAGCLSGLPTWVTTVFGTSPVTATALLAILLNLILPKEAATPEK